MSDRNPFLIAIDLDGTLLDNAGRVPPRNRAALHAAHEAGHRVVLCTGRTFTETEAVLNEIGLDLDAAITMGGALLTDLRSRTTLEAVGFDAELCAAILAWFADRQLAVLWAHDRRGRPEDGYVVPGRRRHPAIDRWIRKTPCRIREDYAARPPDLLPLRLSVIEETDFLHELADAYQREFGTRISHNIIDVPLYGFTVLESFAGGVTKWSAIERLCARWGLDRARTVAIGDDVNDLPMIAAAGLGVAIGNARAAVRAVAGHAVGSNEQGGVAELIEDLLAARISVGASR